MSSVILVSLIFVGFGLILFSFLKKDENFKIDTSEAKEVHDELRKSISDADDAMNEINKLCGDAFVEFEEKYQELLFLYQLLDEKQKSVSYDQKAEGASAGGKKAGNAGKEAESTSGRKAEKNKKLYSNPKLKDIQKLQKQGLSVADIAKKLDMGQGEVELISEMGRER